MGFSPVPISRTARSGIEQGDAVGFVWDQVLGHTNDRELSFWATLGTFPWIQAEQEQDLEFIQLLDYWADIQGN